jgi:hypothetical protein
MSPRQALRHVADRIAGTALDRAIRRGAAGPARGFLFCWNRGLGDVALCLVPVFARVRRAVPGARIAVVTRPDLVDAFRMTDADAVVAIESLRRDEAPTEDRLRAVPGVGPGPWAGVFTDPDVNRWLRGRRREFPPSLRWDPAWNALADAVVPEFDGRITIGAHVHSETSRHYDYDKDWPREAWRELFSRVSDVRGVRWLLFGWTPELRFEGPNVVDLRGRTRYLELASVVRNRCRILIAPDSGVLNTAYYLEDRFPLDVISLWSDPRQGLLRQRCPSPNPLLRHVPLVGAGELARNIPVDAVLAEVRAALEAID